MQGDERENKKRKVEVTKSSEKFNSKAEQVWSQWKPYHIMKRDMILEGITDHLQEWRRRCMDKKWQMKIENDVEHLREYQGIHEVTSRGSKDKFVAGSSSQVETQQALKSSLEQADGISEGLGRVGEELSCRFAARSR